ncbi:RHS repeat-associated core domain-containing protein [Nocardioides sp. NPDC057772]|uniref:RHS repeat-associated core domain-containing protein n=1 Tax=Nocardioides sp. NPDC057772 TaxID=3346245 RepID=UPI003672EE68
MSSGDHRDHGEADQVAVEEEKNTGGTWEVAKNYSYGPSGEKLQLTDTPVNGTTTETQYYGTNPHGDVETLTKADGTTASTYRYTAYGAPDKKGTTGQDAYSTAASETDRMAADLDNVNPYRFSGKRIHGGTGTYDVGFRDYDPGINRFLTRDFYQGALKDLALGTDPWNTNRYAFAGGNPIGRIELDGHMTIADTSGGSSDSSGDGGGFFDGILNLFSGQGDAPKTWTSDGLSEPAPRTYQPKTYENTGSPMDWGPGVVRSLADTYDLLRPRRDPRRLRRRNIRPGLRCI